MFKNQPVVKKENIKLKIVFAAAFVAAALLAPGCAEEHQVELAVEPEEGGRVDGAGSYEYETLVTLEAEPAEGYVFAGWSEDGESVSEEKVYQFEVVEDRNLTALFEKEAACIEVDLFFGNREAVETGQTGEYGYVTPYTIEISDPDAPEALLEAVLEELFKGPHQEEEALTAVVHEQLDILAVVVEPDEGVAEVDVCKEMFGEQWPGGSLSGTVFMQAVVLTATRLPEINAVIVMVEGKLWDDSHRIWDSPMGPEDVL